MENWEKKIRIGKDIEQLSKDTDKDLVPDRLDCQPYNPKKQGFIHEVGKKFAKVVTKEGSQAREKAMQYIKRREEVSEANKKYKAELEEKRRTAYREEALAQAEITGKHRAQVRAEHERKRMSQSGGRGFLANFAKNVAKARQQAPKPMPAVKRRAKRIKVPKVEYVYMTAKKAKKRKTKRKTRRVRRVRVAKRQKRAGKTKTGGFSVPGLEF